MASRAQRASAFRRAVPTVAAATRSWAEGAAVALPPARRRRQLHCSARAKSSIEELDELCEVIRSTKVSSIGIDTLGRFVESSNNARKEFAKKELRETWMIYAATTGGFFVGCLTRARKDEQAEEETRDGSL